MYFCCCCCVVGYDLKFFGLLDRNERKKKRRKRKCDIRTIPKSVFRNELYA